MFVLSKGVHWIFIKVDISLFADKVRESSTDTSDGGHGEHDVSGSIDVGVLDTKDVLELVRTDESHLVRRDLKNQKLKKNKSLNLASLSQNS